jgi:hypothetical protein
MSFTMPALAADQLILGKKLLIKNPPAGVAGNKVVHLGKDPSIVIGPSGGAGDPTCTGAGGGGASSVRIVASGSAGDITIPLPCGGWTTNPANTLYKYKDPTNTTCTLVLVKNGVLAKAICKGSQVAIDVDASMSPVAIVMTLNGDAFCAEFGGTIVKDGADDKTFLRKAASAPAGCATTTPGASTSTSMTISTSTSTSTPSFHYIFVTSQTYGGNLGGLAGADSKCDALATAAGLPGKYLAFLGATGLNAADRFGDFELRLADGVTVVANDKADLVDGALDAAISKDESGMDASARAEVRVWTATSADGNYFGQNCNNVGMSPDWSTTTGRTMTGVLTSATSGWLVGGSVQLCASSLSLYCIEQ